MTKSRSRETLRKTVVALTLFGLVTTGAVGVLGYVLNGPKWPTTEKLYYVNPTNLDVAESAAAAAIQAGAGAWSNESNAAFAFAYAGPTTASTVAYDRTNNVFFRNESSGSTIAVCYYWYSGSQLLDADIMFYDGAFRFFTGTSGCSSGMYIEDVAAHEFGHALGLGHTSVSNATMYPSIPYCNQERRHLDPDDVAGVEALYPPAGTPPSAPTNAQASTAGVTDPTSQIRVAWTDTSSNEDYFFVERSTDQATWMQSPSLAANTTSYVVSGLGASTTYFFRVRANNSAGYSGYSNTASAATGAAPAPPTPPTAPSAPWSPSPADGATGVNENVDLAWMGDAQTYDVYFWEGAPTQPAQLYRTGLSASFLSLPKLKQGTQYSWKVVARSATLSASGNTWSFTTRTKSRGKR